MITRLVLADPSDLVLLGIQSVLKNYLAFEVVQTTRSSGDLFEALQRSPLDVVVCNERLDPALDVLTLTEHIKRASVAKIVILGQWVDGLLIRDLFACGISSYLYLPDDLQGCLVPALKTILSDRPYLSPTANAEYLVAMQSPLRDWQLDAMSRAVLHLLARGLHVSDIARQMNASLRQIYWVRRKLRIRFGAITNEHLISRAAAEGFISRDE